jgi:hypothetical protein
LTFFLLLLLLLSPIVACLLAVLLIPEPLEAGLDLPQHYYTTHRWFFTLAAALPPIDAIQLLS